MSDANDYFEQQTTMPDESEVVTRLTTDEELDAFERATAGLGRKTREHAAPSAPPAPEPDPQDTADKKRRLGIGIAVVIILMIGVIVGAVFIARNNRGGVVPASESYSDTSQPEQRAAESVAVIPDRTQTDAANNATSVQTTKPESTTERVTERETERATQPPVETPEYEPAPTEAPYEEPPAQQPGYEGATIIYYVEDGDNFYTILEKNGFSTDWADIQALMRINGFGDNVVLHTGDPIIVPAD